MITLKDLARQYVKLYECVRRYIWPYTTVEDLANLEIAIYKRFPDIDEVKTKFEQFYRDIKFDCDKDEELKATIEAFREVINSGDIIYSTLDKVNEVHDYENTEEI